MSQFRFQVLEMRRSPPHEWREFWAKRYDDREDYDPKYKPLIERYRAFSADDFRSIGKWKDQAEAAGKWKPNVASVAYRIWEQAAAERPSCPQGEPAVIAFLEDWSNRKYTDEYKSGSREKRFGLSRATTLLHFISGGEYPIFDSRVRTAFARLLGQPELSNTVDAYMAALPLFKELVQQCGAENFRMLDKALFSYGALNQRDFEASRP